MNTYFKLMVAMVAVTLVSAEENPQQQWLEEEVARLQGRWSLSNKAAGDRQARIEREVKGQHQTITIYGRDSKVQYAIEADFTLERFSKARVLHWTNAVVTAGPKKGSKMHDGGFVYTLREGRWICALGLLEDDTLPMKLEIWHPVKDKTL